MSNPATTSIKEQNKSAASSLFRRNVRKFMNNKLALLGLVVVVAITIACVIGFIAGVDFNTPVLPDMKKPPSSVHLFGTDTIGRDLFARVLVGGCYSILIGVFCAVMSSVIGAALGAVAGYFGGRVDGSIMRCMDIMLSIPSILLAITLMAALGKGLDKAVIAIGTVSIPEYARIVRSSILSVKENDYVAAAKVIGNSDGRIIFRHILPNVVSSIVVRATLGISTAILDTAALGFLGMGVQPPMAEWGDMLGRARTYIFSAPYTLIFPGLAITIAVLAFNLFGDGLRDALDPKERV